MITLTPAQLGEHLAAFQRDAADQSAYQLAVKLHACVHAAYRARQFAYTYAGLEAADQRIAKLRTQHAALQQTLEADPHARLVSLATDQLLAEEPPRPSWERR